MYNKIHYKWKKKKVKKKERKKKPKKKKNACWMYLDVKGTK